MLAQSQLEIIYRDDSRPAAQAIADLYRRALLNRPVADVERIRSMYAGSNVVLTAWHGENLVGILRGWTDGAYDGYVCDLAVLPEVQKMGVGRELLRRACEANRNVQWVLRASKIATDYYKHIGWQKIENGWFWPRQPWE
jgi:GNAT superfamily N-acetyltransferase